MSSLFDSDVLKGSGCHKKNMPKIMAFADNESQNGQIESSSLLKEDIFIQMKIILNSKSIIFTTPRMNQESSK